MATMIDHAGYPHIIDRIVRQAPVGALIPLRATCKALQRLVDSILFAHVQLQMFPCDTSLRVMGEMLGFTLPADTALDVASTLPRLPWVPSAVKVLDDPSVGRPGSVGNLIFECPLFTSLDTVRFVDEPHRHPSYNDFEGLNAVYFVTVTTDRAHISAPERCRLVLHLRMEGDDLSKNIWTVGRRGIREYVLVFWPSAFLNETWCFDAIWNAAYYHGRGG